MKSAEYHDAVTYTPPVLRVVDDEESLKLFMDKNLLLVLRVLREQKRPMTVKDIEAAFKKIEIEKSDKTIYRYIARLEKSGLVVQAGKRIFTDEQHKMKTQTLYSRTAKIFFPRKSAKMKLAEEDRQKKQHMTRTLRVLIGNIFAFEERKGSEDCLANLIDTISKRKSELIIEMAEASIEELDDLITDLSLDEINSLLDKASLLAILNEKDDWHEELANCFAESS
jgi:Fe2+ or Zn2+ uptake regulation protein